MAEELEAEARTILASLPCSIEMPAGTGKTHIVVAMTGEAAANGERALILTHTNAGVDALRKRLTKHNVDPKSYHVDTITGWAIDLVRHYPTLAEMVAPNIIDPNDSDSFVIGSTKVVRAAALVRMLRNSFHYLFVDEYQDCVIEHHELVAALANAIPQCAIFGDPLQGIFDFGGQLVDWPTHVHPLFPTFTRTHEPWRWNDHNQDLGRWLISIRPLMVTDGVLDLSKVQVPGLEWKPKGTQGEIQAAYAAANRGGSAAILHAQRNQHKTVGRAAKGMYSIMESLHGTYMHDQLEKLAGIEPVGYARWFADAAKECFSGFGDLNAAVLGRLERNVSLIGLSRPTIPRAMDIVESVRQQPSIATLAAAMYALAKNSEGLCYAHEAWYDMAKSLARAAVDDLSARDHLAAIRSRLRYTGRKPREKILSKTLLVKGLEYDHVVIANADSIGNHKHLYVAMTRPRKTLTILSASPIIRLT